MGTSLFSLVRVRRFTVIVRSFSLWGSSAWTRNNTRNQEGGSPEFEKSPNASSKVRLQLRRVVRTPCHPKPDNRSDGILLSNVPPVNEIMLWAVGYSRQLGAGCGLSRPALFNTEPPPGCRLDGSFLQDGSGRMGPPI